jgi:hypothetical protein
MKYIKLFEELEQHYITSPFGWDDRDKKEAFFVVTEDEKWILRNNLSPDRGLWAGISGPNYVYNRVYMTPIDIDFPDQLHQLSFKSKKEANDFIDNIYKNDFRGQSIKSNFKNNNIKYNNKIVGDYVLIDIKDNLKVVSYLSGKFRTDNNPLSFI